MHTKWIWKNLISHRSSDNSNLGLLSHVMGYSDTNNCSIPAMLLPYYALLIAGHSFHLNKSSFPFSFIIISSYIWSFLLIVLYVLLVLLFTMVCMHLLNHHLLHILSTLHSSIQVLNIYRYQHITSIWVAVLQCLESF